MYPRNAAAPPEVDLGQILQLSDGAIQTTGASVRVKIGTGAWGSGAGTLSCDSTSGIWTYAPTQAETNAAYFIVGAYKSGCTALSKTVVTSVSSTAGYAGLDWANILAPTTTVNLSGTTVKTATDVETDTQDIQTRLPAALVSGRIDSSVGAYQAGLAPPTAVDNATQVRTELGLTGTLDSAFDAIPTAAENGAAGWDALQVDHTSTGSFGAAIGALSASSGSGARTVTVTVNDGTNALQNARVRLTNGAETYTGLTNASGVVVFNVDDADWVVSITKAGYSYSGTTLTVNGTETATYSMSLISLTASDVDKVTGYWTVLDEEGNEASGIVVTVKARQASRGSAGALHDAATRTATSAANGLVQFTNMIPGWRYSVVANDEYVADFTVPADAVTSVELGSIVARLT